MSTAIANLDIALPSPEAERPTYTDCKNTNIDWFGEVPEHWLVNRLKWTTGGCRNGIWGNEPDGENDLICVRVADFNRTAFRVNIDDPTLRAVEQKDRSGRLLECGDLLLEKSGGGENQPVGAVMLYDHTAPAVCSNFVAKMTVADGFAANYLVYLHSHLYAKRINTRSIKQTTGIQNLDSQAYLDEIVAYPAELSEQQIIAAFLDRETAKIDDLITKKERLIELLREKRTALISQAVTKGLDPNVPMKDSGVEWLGEVPEHWETTRVGLLYADTADCGSDELPVLQVSIHHGVSDHELTADESDRKIVRIDDKSKYKHVMPNDLVYNMMRAWQGAFGAVKVEGMVSPAYVVARPKGDFLSVYVEHLFRTPQAIEQMRRHSHGVADFRLRLYWDKFKYVRLAIPDKNEQQVICDHIDRINAKSDRLAAEAKRGIGLLSEYRTALISAAVTGKIDVRGEVEQPQAAVAVETANDFYLRTVFAAEIVRQLYAEQTFGRLKLQKLLYLAEHHLRLQGFRSRYLRAERGPHDQQLMDQVETDLELLGWYKANPRDNKVDYSPLSAAGQHEVDFQAQWGATTEGLQGLIELLRKRKSTWCGKVATLFASWNDFLLLGSHPTDADIITDVLENWHPKKQRIKPDSWAKTLTWMRAYQLVPTGFGELTVKGAACE